MSEISSHNVFKWWRSTEKIIDCLLSRSREVPRCLQKCNGCCSPAHLGAPHCSQTTDCDMTQSAATAGLLSEPPPFSTPLTTPRIPQPSCTCKKHPKQLMTHGNEQYKNTAAQPSRTQLCQKSNRVASHPNTTTTTLKPHLLHTEKAGSAHHSSKRNFPDCLTVTDCDA